MDIKYKALWDVESGEVATAVPRRNNRAMTATNTINA
jgi:hypothetical protein